MWTRLYLLLVLVRLYFALSPSYIHPDENFQGPEVIAGNIFGFPHHRTWEFTAAQPVRSVFPLWPVYGLPMVILRWVWTETGIEEVAPYIIYNTLRIVMFMLSFVFEDWAIHELVHSPRQRQVAVLLVASSYITWTYQTHTFSNSVETVMVLWSLVLIQRILETKQRSSLFASGILGFLVITGTFNRITFPTFLLIPSLSLLPHFYRKPLSLASLLLSASLTAALAITTDTAFYNPTTHSITLSTLIHDPIITPLNSLLYNTSLSNLSTHGLHPHYQHLLVNLPLLLLPSLPLYLSTLPTLTLSHPPTLQNLPIQTLSLLPSLFLLSLIPHQEPRFLLPLVPLLLSSIRLPRSPFLTRLFLTTWLLFNSLLALLMGTYHQAGVIPTQLWLGQAASSPTLENIHTVLWWRTYSPPEWLLDGAGLHTVDLMGGPVEKLLAAVDAQVARCGEERDNQRVARAVVVVAPRSSVELDRWTGGGGGGEAVDAQWVWEEIWSVRRHLNLDDLEWGEEGVWGTLKRVVGRRGLSAWRVERRCAEKMGLEAGE
ncbi:alpha 1,2 mannosyltransferase [Loxospora ochrophaea]|nr:alpha 1,2 mannosyltransferase [Loxospora ochrophaea]